MRKKILIIEDNAIIREGFSNVINNTSNFEVCGQYESCESAFKNWDYLQPDLILMDIDLPGINGVEGTKIFKKHFPECIVLIITVFEDGNKVFQSLCAGAGGYIVKNSEPESILKWISEAFEGGAPMSLHIAKMVVQSFRYSIDSPLSDREREVLSGISVGKSYSKIALDLFISKETVRSHIKNIYEKLAVNNKADALKVADQNKWLNKKFW